MSEANIPPVMRVLMDEDWGSLNSFSDFAKKYKRISPEIAAQAEYGYENFEYFEERKPKDHSLVITAGGGLDPFSGRDICSEPKCRIKSAKEIARTLGLYADVITIADPLSYFLAESKKPTTKDIRWILNQMLILRELYPLIEAGIIRFWSGRVGICKQCYRNVEIEIGKVADDLSEQLDEYIHVEVIDDHLAISTTGIIESQTSILYKLKAADKRKISAGTTIHQLAKEIAVEEIKGSMRDSLIEMNHSKRISSVLFSTSRKELYALKSFDKDAPSLNTLAVWEKARSIELPWVSELSPTQIVQLRESAEKALPAFRGTFVSHIASPTATAESVSNRIEQLRESAFDVESELRSLDIPGEKAFRNIAGTLGLTISVYGAAAGFVSTGTALGGLMTILGLVHASGRHDEQKIISLQSQPGYVLLRAKELLEHA